MPFDGLRRVVIRVDASVQIGTGHTMRCLTLADLLKRNGSDVCFISREQKGNLCDLIQENGFTVIRLSQFKTTTNVENISGYAGWLGATWQEDAEQTRVAIKALGVKPDWLIVDHYALDRRWERFLRTLVEGIMVIDDLANRPHDCDLLLDQNFYANDGSHYDGLVPSTCTRLLGPGFAILRPEFVQVRKRLKERKGNINHVFVFFGGTDPDNVTSIALQALSAPEFQHLTVDVVIGSNNPHKPNLEEQIAAFPNTTLHIEVSNMASLMEKADIALGAGGSTTWERCCLGLPSIVISIADNQTEINELLHTAGYVNFLGSLNQVDAAKIRNALRDSINNPKRIAKQSNLGLELVHGDGLNRVVQKIFELESRQESAST